MELQGNNEPVHTVHFPYGVHDPRDIGSSDESDGGFGRGPRRKDERYSAGASSSGPRHAQPPPKAGPPPPPQPKTRPKPQPKEPPRPKKPAHSNLSLTNTPPPVMFSESSLSADEDEGLIVETNEWIYPNVKLVGRKMKTYTRPMFKEENTKVIIVLHTDQSDEPCGMYDEGLVPQNDARELVTEWEVLLRRTTIYLCAWSDGIPKILRKYILKGNAEWVKLYRYIWLKSQANYLGVFPTPKTFALATCTDFEADESCRNRMKTEFIATCKDERLCRNANC